MVPAQIAAAEASGQASAPASAWPAGCRPSDRLAGGRGRTDPTDLAGGMPGGHEARPALPGRPGMAALRGRAGAGPGRAGGDYSTTLNAPQCTIS